MPSMLTITLPKNEYLKLKKESREYRRLSARIYETVVDDIGNIVEDFRKTSLYTDEFLIDLEDGLRKSSYGK